MARILAPLAENGRRYWMFASVSGSASVWPSVSAKLRVARGASEQKHDARRVT
jgi:hypothetical protein